MSRRSGALKIPRVPFVPLRVLLVAYYYPPLNVIGARRPYSLARWLTRRGHTVRILTTVHGGTAPDDATSGVMRARDLLATGLNWRRQDSALDAISGRSDVAVPVAPSGVANLFVPEVQLISWAPFAVAAGRRLARTWEPDVVVTTSPVESAHAVGLALHRKGIPWVADLRDGWRFEPPRPEWPTAIQRRFDDALERGTLSRADARVVISAPIAEDLDERLGLHASVIPNGFDPDDAPSAGAVARAPVDPDRFTIVHTGGLWTGKTLLGLLEALERLDAPVELVLAGPQTADEREHYADPRFAAFVRHVGHLPRAEALALQRAADALVVVTDGARRSEVTGKLAEYLAAGPPILALAAGTAAGDIVAEQDAGVVVAAGDSAAIEAAVRTLLTAEPVAPQSRPDYLWPQLAERYETVLRGVVR